MDGNRRLCVALLLLVTTFSSAAQEPPDSIWGRALGGNQADFGYSMEPTADGKFIIAGITASQGAGECDLWLIKIDEDGNVEWDCTYGGEEDDMGRHAAQTLDGGYVITGTTESFDAVGSDVCLIKTDELGVMEWNRKFGGSGDDLGNCVRQTADGGYIIAGRTESYGAGHYDFWLIKTDADGCLKWSSTFGGGNNDYGYSVEQTPDGGYILAGYTESFGAGGADIWLIRTDAFGQEVWNRTYGGRDHDYGGSVKPTGDGGYIIAGETHSFGAGCGDVWLIKTDSEGLEEWSNSYGGSGLDGGYPALRACDAGYLIAGWTESYGAGQADIWLIKTDRQGHEIWNRTFGGPHHDWGLGVQEAPDGKYLVTGFGYSGSDRNYDLVVICAQETNSSTPDANSSPHPASFTILTPYPNPFNDQVILSFSLPEASTISLVIYDIQGQPVAEPARGCYQAGVHQVLFKARNLASGVYFIRLKTAGLVLTRKCLLLR